MTILSVSDEAKPPAGFVPMEPYGPFHELVGPLYVAEQDGRTVVGLRVAEKHRNKGAMIHGGMFLMLLDTAMTHACARVRRADRVGVTTSLSSELFAPAAPGDWVQAEVEVMRAGGRVVFLNCVVRRDGPDGELLARGSSTFQLVARESRAGP